MKGAGDREPLTLAHRNGLQKDGSKGTAGWAPAALSYGAAADQHEPTGEVERVWLAIHLPYNAAAQLHIPEQTPTPGPPLAPPNPKRLARAFRGHCKTFGGPPVFPLKDPQVLPHTPRSGQPAAGESLHHMRTHFFAHQSPGARLRTTAPPRHRTAWHRGNTSSPTHKPVLCPQSAEQTRIQSE